MRIEILLLVLLLAGCVRIAEIPDNRNFCPEERGMICTMEYVPVCGYFGDNIQCVKEPCAKTYSNGCSACSDTKVEYWIDGECE